MNGNRGRPRQIRRRTSDSPLCSSGAPSPVLCALWSVVYHEQHCRPRLGVGERCLEIVRARPSLHAWPYLALLCASRRPVTTGGFRTDMRHVCISLFWSRWGCLHFMTLVMCPTQHPPRAGSAMVLVPVRVMYHTPPMLPMFPMPLGPKLQIRCYTFWRRR